MQRAQQSFDPMEASVALARAFVRATLDRWDLAGDEAELVVSELATNVLRHARGRFHVCMERIDDTLLIEVSDVSDVRPHLSQPATDDTGGRGLFIVEQVSCAWGSKADPRGGKRVWAELALDGAESSNRL